MATDVQRQAFRVALQRARADAQMSQRDLSRALDVSPGTVSQWEMGESAPRADTAAALEMVLKVPEGTFSRMLGFLPLSVQVKAVSTVVEAIKTDPHLDERDRALLTNIYRQFVRQHR